MVPTIIVLPARRRARRRARRWPRIRFCRSASAALPPEHLRAFEAASSASASSRPWASPKPWRRRFTNPLDPAQRKLGAVGRASRLRSARDRRRAAAACPTATTGEIAIRGANVMRGYYKDPEATAAAFTPDGWLRTGDLGHRDADGFFFVTGRIKELIIKGGENIAPREIDEALLQPPGRARSRRGRHPRQALRPGDPGLRGAARPAPMPATEATLRAFCEQHLGRYKTPKLIRFVDRTAARALGQGAAAEAAGAHEAVPSADPLGCRHVGQTRAGANLGVMVQIVAASTRCALA